MTNPSLIDAEALTDAGCGQPLPRMSEEEFLAWLPSEKNAEWVNGEVILTSPAALRHVRITNWLDRVLGTYIAIKKLGELLGPEFMVRLEHNGVSRRVPDLLFLSQDPVRLASGNRVHQQRTETSLRSGPASSPWQGGCDDGDLVESDGLEHPAGQ